MATYMDQGPGPRLRVSVFEDFLNYHDSEKVMNYQIIINKMLIKLNPLIFTCYYLFLYLLSSKNFKVSSFLINYKIVEKGESKTK